MSKLKLGLAISLVIGVVVLTAVSVRLVRAESPTSRVTICISKNFTNAFLVLAQEKKYFASEGIDAQLLIAPLGKDCAEKLKNGQVQLAVAYDTPIIHQIATGESWRILTELHSSTRNTSIVYSRKSGIDSPEKLAGTRLAMIPGTNGEFLIELYCMAHDLDCASITKVPIALADVPTLFSMDKADAVVMWEPMVSALLKSDPENLGTLRAAFYTEFSVLAAKEEFVAKHEAELVHFMKALFRAQEFFNDNPVDAKRIALTRLGYSSSEMELVNWSKIHVSLGLSAVLRSMLEHELDTRMTKPGMPGFDVSGAVAALFEPKFLRAASAELVTYE